MKGGWRPISRSVCLKGWDETEIMTLQKEESVRYCINNIHAN